MRTADFDFDLPEDRIAVRPARPRDSARLLRVTPSGPFSDHIVRDLPDVLRSGDLLVVNDTRVIHAALPGTRAPRPAAAAQGEATPVTLEVNLHAQDDPAIWRAFVRPAKRVATGDILSFAAGLSARIVEKLDAGEVRLAFDRAGPALDAAIEAAGAPPLPPYIARQRPPDALDEEDYQTVFAREGRSVAAPTAGLHLTPQLLQTLEQRGVGLARVRLDVGAGTFLPVKAEAVRDHRMHAERYVISAETAARIAATRAAGGRIVAVGTTSLRTLEASAALHGVVTAEARETDIFITPGFAFRAVDVLLTNFHLPKSTLFMLVSAFSGTARMKAAYAHAVTTGYRFYSYGDACLLERGEGDVGEPS